MIGLDDPLSNGSTIRALVNGARKSKEHEEARAKEGGAGSREAEKLAANWTGRLQGYFTLLTLLGIISENDAIPSEKPEQLYIVRLWDGFDGEWMDVSEPLPREEAVQICGDKNENRRGSAAGKRTGNYSDIDYYSVFPADTTMRFSEGRSQTREST